MFTYTDQNGRTHTVDLEIVDVLDARREDPPVLWYANNDTRAGIGECMRTRCGVAANPSRLGAIRLSPEWRRSVEIYASDRNLDLEPILADSIPRRNRRTTAQESSQPTAQATAQPLRTAQGTRVQPLPGSRTAREQSRQRLNPAVAGSRTARAEARQRMEAHTNPPPRPATAMPTRYFGVELEVIAKVKRKPIQRALRRSVWNHGSEDGRDRSTAHGDSAPTHPSSRALPTRGKDTRRSLKSSHRSCRGRRVSPNSNVSWKPSDRSCGRIKAVVSTATSTSSTSA